MPAVDEHKDTHQVLSFAEIIFDHFLPFLPLTLGDLGEAITRQIDHIPFVVDIEMIDQLGLPGSIGGLGHLVIIAKHVDQRGFANIAATNEGILGPIRRRTFGMIRTADDINGGVNVHKGCKIHYPTFTTSMANYSHDRIVPFKDSELGKKQQIAAMFDKIAFRYDFLNRFLSGGIDIYWRRRAIRELARVENKHKGPPTGTDATAATADASSKGAAATITSRTILDVATGTADMAIMMARYLSTSHITGIDISTGMLEIGRQKITRLQMEQKISLQTGDSEAINFPDAHFDAVTVAFGVRNFENLEKGLREMLRVLKPGGRLVVLEFSQPKTPGVRHIYDLYLRLVAPNIGKMVSSNREAYQYLNDSVKAFPEGENFLRIMETCGYTDPRLRRLSLGICSLYIGEKKG